VSFAISLFAAASSTLLSFLSLPLACSRSSYALHTRRIPAGGTTLFSSCSTPQAAVRRDAAAQVEATSSADVADAAPPAEGRSAFTTSSSVATWRL
jgi:hypothetical protein